jgi:hypothetical protein
MCKLFSEWESDIKKYCADNDLNFAKAKQCGQCWRPDFLMLQHVDKEKGIRGLRDETPAPVVLTIRKNNNSLIFEQTEYTRRYLAQ